MNYAKRRIDTGFGVSLEVNCDAESEPILTGACLPNWRVVPTRQAGPTLEVQAWRIGDTFQCRFQEVSSPALPDVESSVVWLTRHLHLTLAQVAPEHTFVHAGVVALHGKAILLPGSSYRGKSTLVRALLSAGAKFYSDEYAVVDAAGQVWPYPRAMALRQTDGSELRIPATQLGWTGSELPLRARAVVITTFSDKDKWRVEQISTGEGVLECLSHTVSAQAQARRDVSALINLLRGATVWRGVRGEADAATQEILLL